MRREGGRVWTSVLAARDGRLEDFMTQSRWGHRVFGGMLTVFAFVALALAVDAWRRQNL
jgi:heme A synthase